MTASACYDRADIQAAGMDVEAVSDVCYLVSYISYNGSYERMSGCTLESGGGFWKDERGLEEQ